MTKTKIEWTDRTWTPVVGCDPVSPACTNCYAALMAARLEAMGHEKYAGIATRQGNRGKWTGKVTLWEPELLAPLKVRKPQTWFLTSMGDVGHEAVPDWFLADIFGVMAVAGAAGPFHREEDGCDIRGGWTNTNGSWVDARWPRMHSGPHTFYVLTKRPGRLAELLASQQFRKKVAQAAYKWAADRTPASQIADGIYPFSTDADSTRYWPLPNVLIGCTAEDQPRADDRRQHMASIAAAGWRTFVSYEPALGPVDWAGWEFLSWLISGGESGQGARPSHPDWHRVARDWCAANGVPYLFKQWGEWRHTPERAHFKEAYREPWKRQESGTNGVRPALMARVGKKAAGRLLDGVEHNGKPEVRHE